MLKLLSIAVVAMGFIDLFWWMRYLLEVMQAMLR